MLTGLVIFSGIGTVCGGMIFQWRRNAAMRQANMFKVGSGFTGHGSTVLNCIVLRLSVLVMQWPTA